MSLSKKDIHCGSVLNSSENQTWRHKSGLQKDDSYQGFCFLTPTPALSLQFKSFLFLSRFANRSWNWFWRLFSHPLNDTECKARLLCNGLSFKGKQIYSWKSHNLKMLCSVKFWIKLHHPLQIWRMYPVRRVLTAYYKHCFLISIVIWILFKSKLWVLVIPCIIAPVDIFLLLGVVI